MSTPAERAGALLTIDLDALADNWRLLRDRLVGAACAGVVKADAYGLGMDRVAPALWNAGCRTFFVAHLDEGMALRARLPDAAIHVLNGPLPGTGGDFAAHRLIPVLNSLEQIATWEIACRTAGTALPCDLHVDTGMSRLGLPAGELAELAADPHRLGGCDPRLVMSHLARADEPDDPMNESQLAAFESARAALAGAGLRAPASFANSSGIFLGPRFHFDLARPGVALHGVAPFADRPNPMRQVVRLQGKILQVRDIDSPMTVGYGATHRARGPARIATVAVGYADGFSRALSNRGAGYVDGHRVALVGRVSMDLITFDTTDVPEPLVRPGALIDLIGPDNTVDQVAAAADTIGYEILTALGDRYHRTYLGDGSGAR